MVDEELTRSYGGKRVLVTGGAGFIGSHLVDRLVELGARVAVIDDLSSGSTANLAASAAAIKFSRCSLVDPAGLQPVVRGSDVVFHLAANASVPLSVERPLHDFESNVRGTFCILEAIRRLGAPPVVYASSAAVYGEPEKARMDEAHPLRPRSPYGGSKLAGEVIGDSFARCYGLDFRRARIFNTYGPRQRRYVMFDLLEKLRRDPRRLEVLGDGEQERDYCYVGDTVTALLVIGMHDGARNGVYNIAGGKPTRIRDLVPLIVGSVGIMRPEITYTCSSWQGDVQRMVGDTTSLRALGWRPETDLVTGLRHLLEWHRAEFHPPW